MADDLRTEDFAQQGTELPKGASQQLEQAVEVAKQATAEVAAPPATAPEPVVPSQSTEPFPTVYSTVADDMDSELLGPTDYPNIPLQGGRPVPVRGPVETDTEFLDRVARGMLSDASSLPDDAKLWAARQLAGA